MKVELKVRILKFLSSDEARLFPMFKAIQSTMMIKLRTGYRVPSTGTENY